MKTTLTTIGAMIGAFAMLATASAAFAQGHSMPTVPHKHNSNTLSKIGKSIEYTTRKDTENVTSDVHRTTHSKSIVRNRHTGNNYVLKPNGHHVFKSTTNHRILHRKYGRHYRRHLAH